MRVKTVVQDGRSYEYLQIVRSVRDGTRVRQELVASLGRRDLLVATGQLDQLLQALARFSTRLRVVEAAKDERFVARAGQELGPGLGLRPAVATAGPAGDARPPGRGSPVRLRPRAGGLRARPAAAVRSGLGPARRRLGADGRGARLRRTWRCTTSTARCHGWRRSATSSSASSSSRTATCSRASSTWCSSTPPRSTSTATARAHLVRHGYSRDRRPDLPQLVLCVAVDGQGWPVAFDVLPGNTADVEALRLTIARFRERFRIRRAVVVADRGMLGKGTLAELRAHVEAPFDYILGCPLRRERAVALEVLARPGRYQHRRGQPRGQGGQARRAPLRGLPQPDRGEAGRRRP